MRRDGREKRERKRVGRSDEYRRGAIAASQIADDYNASTTHGHRLGDCILAKMNLRRGAPRRNTMRLEDPGSRWIRAFAAGIVLMQTRLLQGADSEGVRAAARAANLSLADFRRAGVNASDLRVLRQAGVPARR